MSKELKKFFDEYDGLSDKDKKATWAIVGKPGECVGTRGEFCMMSARNVTTDPETQRELCDHRVKEIAAEFCWIAFGVCCGTICPEDPDTVYLFDGQQRTAAARKALGEDVKIPVMVFRAKNRAEARRIRIVGFIKMNCMRGLVTAIKKFEMATKWGKPLETEITTFLRMHGLVVGTGKNDPTKVDFPKDLMRFWEEEVADGSKAQARSWSKRAIILQLRLAAELNERIYGRVHKAFWRLMQDGQDLNKYFDILRGIGGTKAMMKMIGDYLRDIDVDHDRGNLNNCACAFMRYINTHGGHMTWNTEPKGKAAHAYKKIRKAA